MTLRKKTLGIVSLILLVLIGTLYLTSQYIVLGGFNQTEEQQAQQAVNRVLSAIDESRASLDATARNWAAQNDAYNFVQDHNVEYLKDRFFPEQTFAGNRLSLVVLLNGQADRLFAASYDLTKQEPSTGPPSLADHLGITSPLLYRPNPLAGVSGILALPEGPMLVAAEPILQSGRVGPPRGTMILGRSLDDQELAHLSKLTAVLVTAWLVNDPHLPPDFQAVLPELTPEAGSVARPLGDAQRIAGYALVNDVYGKPAVIWRADMPRAVYIQGQVTVWYYVLILLAAGIVFTAAMLLLLERLVLARVTFLNEWVRSIGASGNLSARVALARRKEPGALGRALSDPLERVLHRLARLAHRWWGHPAQAPDGGPAFAADEPGPAPGRDELVRLGDSINGMLTALEGAYVELQKNEERYRHMFTKNAAIQLVIDPALGQIIDANPAAAAFYGCALDLLRHMRLTDISPLPADNVMLELARLATEKSSYYQTRHRRATGDTREVEIYASPVEIQGRRLLYSIVHDITDRKEAERLIQRSVERLAALRSIEMAISASLDLPVILNIILEQIHAHLGLDAADVLLCNRQTGRLEYAAGQGFHSPIFATTPRRLEGNTALQAVLALHTVSVPDLTEHPDFLIAPGLDDEGFVAYHAVPLVVKGQVNGALEVFHRMALQADPEWLDFVEAVADQAAIAIDNATLVHDLQRSNEELARAYDSTLEGWSRALDLRDKETEGHSRRVTELTLRLAGAMGVHEAEMIHVRRGALLHDIGKMGIPDRILLKPGPLDPEELAIMRQHPGFAYELLKPIPFLRPALAIPYCHHERWDGTGYPRRLRGTQIPLAARIFTVVDVWDALRSDRPYRAAWSVDKVRDHIRSLSGTHFDPQVVTTFLELTENMVEEDRPSHHPPARTPAEAQLIA